jgi:hypothetical protein
MWVPFLSVREPLRFIFAFHLFGLRLRSLQRRASGVALVTLDSLLPSGMLMSASAHDGGRRRLIRGGHGLSFLAETLLGRLLKPRRFHHQPHIASVRTRKVC